MKISLITQVINNISIIQTYLSLIAATRLSITEESIFKSFGTNGFKSGLTSTSFSEALVVIAVAVLFVFRSSIGLLDSFLISKLSSPLSSYSSVYSVYPLVVSLSHTLFDVVLLIDSKYNTIL